MKGKIILIGGVVHFVVTMIVGMLGTGPLVHNNILKETYKATVSFWRPELTKEPPDMGAVMPMWITIGIISSLVIAFLYSTVRGSFAGPGWKKGLAFGFGLSLFAAVTMAGWAGVFNLPANLWLWWGVEYFVLSLIGCAAMGWATERWAGA